MEFVREDNTVLEEDDQIFVSAAKKQTETTAAFAVKVVG